MAALHEAPRKKLATYGKAARRRIPNVNPEYNAVFFGGGGGESKSQTPEVQLTSEFPVSRHMSPALEPKPTKRIPSQERPIDSVPPPAAKVDIYELSEDEAPAPKAKTVPTKTTTRPKVTSSSSAITVANSIFDVPSSDDEVRIISKTKKPSVKSTEVRVLSSEKSQTSAEPTDLPEQRKRLKLSPKEEQGKKAVVPITTKKALSSSSTIAKLVKTTSSVSNGGASTIKKPNKVTVLESSKATINATKISRALSQPSKGLISTIVTRPKLQTRKTLENPHTPQKPIQQPPQQEKCLTPIQSIPSPQLSDVDMMDVDPQGKYISPRGAKLWKDLLERDDEEVEIISTKIAGRGPSPGKISPPIFGKKLSKPAGISKPAQKTPRNVPRKRLIDLLVEQASSEASEDESDGSDAMDGVNSPPQDSRGYLSRAQSAVPEIIPPMQSGSQSQGSQITGPKFVYGRERTVLAEKDFMQALEAEMPTVDSQVPGGRRTRRGSIPTLPVLASFHDMDLDEGEGTGAAILSVHELRQAGANNRFNDELDDFLDRIGSPGGANASMRRSGLLDLANKLKDKNFARQFRSNAAEEKLFVHLGKETDVVAGFVIVAMLTSIFADGNVSHIVTQLRRQGITRLLIRLLENNSSIQTISKERKSNMSKISQSLLAEYHDHLIQLPVWEESPPQSISPRTIALKCLEKMVRQTREAGITGDIFSKELTGKLFDILKTASDPDTWNLLKAKQAIDFSLALSALESHSITARTADNEAIWISDFLPVIADTLEVALSQKAEDFGDTQLLILRLALNVTNNNAKGADVFARPALLAVMGSVVVAKFKKIARFLREEEFCIVMDHLVLTLGVMINFAEWSTPARLVLQGLEGRSDDPLDRMVQLFLDNREQMAEVCRVRYRNGFTNAN